MDENIRNEIREHIQNEVKSCWRDLDIICEPLGEKYSHSIIFSALIGYAAGLAFDCNQPPEAFREYLDDACRSYEKQWSCK